MVVGNIGRGSNHADKPTCRQYPMVLGGNGGEGGSEGKYMPTIRHVDMPATTVLFI